MTENESEMMTFSISKDYNTKMKILAALKDKSKTALLREWIDANWDDKLNIILKQKQSEE